MKPTQLALALLALAPLPASGRTLDRRAVVRAAMAENPRVAAARAEEAVVEAQRRQVDAARWPIFTLDAGVGPSLKATRVPGTAADSVEQPYAGLRLADLSAVLGGQLTVIQPLYTFGKIALRQEATGHGVRARQAQTRMERADVAVEVARIYEGYLLARDADRFMTEILHSLDKTLQSTQDKVARNVGGATERDVLRMETGIEMARMGQRQARAGMAQARAGVVAYLGLPRADDFSVAEDELLPVGTLPPDFESLVALAQQNRPEKLALAEGTQALEALARAEAAGFYPDVFVMAFLRAAYTPGRDWVQTRFVVDPLNHFAPGALIGLRWQFQGPTPAARADEQRARSAVLHRLGQWAGGAIPAEVRKAYEDARRATQDIDQGGQAVSRSKKWMVQASADYAVGLAELREVSDAVQAYVSLRTSVLQARYQHNVAMAELSRATGTLDAGADLFYLEAKP